MSDLYNLSLLKIVNKLSDNTDKIVEILDNYTEYDNEILSILKNPQVEEFVTKFIGYSETMSAINAVPKQEINMSDLRRLLDAQPVYVDDEDNYQDEEDNYYNEEDNYQDEEDNYQDEDSTLNENYLPTMTPEQAQQIYRLSDSDVQDLSKQNEIHSLSDSATNETEEDIDTSSLPKIIPDVEELLQAICIRNKAVFESCLQLDRPYGMLYDKGMLSYAIVDGKVMYRGGENRGGKSLFERLYKAILKGSNTNINCAKDLRNVPNYDNLSKLNVDYYPGYMFKYALGIVDNKPYKAWGKFEKALKESLRDRLRKFYASDEDFFFNNFNRIEAALCTTMLVLSYEAGTGIKIRLSLPGVKLDLQNIEKSIREITTFRNASITILSMAGNEDVIDIQILQDEDKYLNRPYWAYQAMKVKINNGEEISLSGGLPIGRKANGEIVDFKLDPSARFMNFLAAGSGSGKGVMTLSIVAAAIGSGIPVMYVDFKPDMAEIFWKAEQQYGIKTFTYDAMGVNRRGTPDEREFNSSLPEYAQAELGQFTSVIFYMKAVQLMCAMAQRRADVGYEGQIMFVFDETQALQMQVKPLVNKLNDIRKKLTKAKQTDSELFVYCNMLSDWLVNVDSNMSIYINTTGRKSATFTLFIAQSPDYSVWNDMQASLDGGGKIQLLSQVNSAGTVFKMIGKGGTTSKYGLGGKVDIPAKELQYVSNNRFFGMYDGKTTDGAKITIFKPFLTLNYDDPFEDCWVNGLGQSFGAGSLSDEEYIQNILTEHLGEEGYCNQYGIHTGTGLLGLTSMYCKGDMEKVKMGLQSGLEYANQFLIDTGLNGKYSNIDDYMFDLSFDGLMLIDNMIEYVPSKENSIQRGLNSSDNSSVEELNPNEEMYAFDIDDQVELEENDPFLENDPLLDDAFLDEQDTEQPETDQQDIQDTNNFLDNIESEVMGDLDQIENLNQTENNQANTFDDEDYFDDTDFEDSSFEDSLLDNLAEDGLVGYQDLDFKLPIENVQEFDDNKLIEPNIDIPEMQVQPQEVPVNSQEVYQETQENIEDTSVTDLGTNGVVIKNDKIILTDGNLVNAQQKGDIVSLQPTHSVLNVVNLIKLSSLFVLNTEGEEAPNEFTVEKDCLLGINLDGTYKLIEKGKVTLYTVNKFNKDEIIEKAVDDYIPENVSNNDIELAESIVIESVDPNAEDYLGAVTRMLLHKYKIGNIEKAVAENVALKMNLKENGYLQSYDLNTQNNYIGPVPSKIPVEVVEKGITATNKANKTVIIDENSIDPNNQVILDNSNVIRCQNISRGIAGAFKNYMQENPESILSYADDMWKQLLFNCKRFESNINIVELTNGQMRINKKLVDLNGIIDNDNFNRDSITLASLVNFKLLFKYFNEIELLLIDEQILEIGYIEFGRTVIKEMFNRCNSLNTVIIQQSSNGTLKKITKPQNTEYEQDSNVNNLINQKADRVNLKINCFSKRTKNFTNQSFSDRLLNTKISNGNNDNANKMHIEKTKGFKSVLGKLGKKLIDLGGGGK